MNGTRPKGVSMANPIEWFEWIYGKWFVGHPWRGYFAILIASCMVLSLIIGALWLKALDQYTEKPAPKRQTATATNSSASQSVTVQHSTSAQGMQSDTSAQPTAQTELRSAKPSKTAKPIQQVAFPKQDAKPAPAPPPGTTNTTRVLVDGGIFENAPNKLEVQDPGTTFTNNTVRGMDASVTHGAYADNNDFEGREASMQPPQSGGKGADMAAIRKAQTRNQYPGGFPDEPWPLANAVLLGTTSGVADQLARFIDEGYKIAADFRKDHNAQLIREKEKTWEAEVQANITTNLGQRFAQEFDEKELASDPQRRNADGGNICSLIDAKIEVLSEFVKQLRAAKP